MNEFGRHYLRGLGMSARSNALAYGYSITATGSFAMLSHTAGRISVLKIFVFVAGAGLAFSGVNALVTRGYRQRVEREPPVVMALATSFNVVSSAAGIGVAAAFGWGIGGWLAWLLGALFASWGYLSIAALETAIARTLHLTLGDVDPEER